MKKQTKTKLAAYKKGKSAKAKAQRSADEFFNYMDKRHEKILSNK